MPGSSEEDPCIESFSGKYCLRLVRLSNAHDAGRDPDPVTRPPYNSPFPIAKAARAAGERGKWEKSHGDWIAQASSRNGLKEPATRALGITQAIGSRSQQNIIQRRA